MKPADEAKKIIAENIYMTVATSSLDGKPWISPVFFSYDEGYNLYWVSNKDSRHSTLIRKNPQAAIVIFNSHEPEGEGDGVYFEARIEELSDEKEIEQAINIMNKRISKEELRIKKLDYVTGNGVWRIYKAIPYKVSKLVEGEYINGQYVDKRSEINLME